MSYKIAILVGSLRKASWNRKIAKELNKIAPSGMSFEIIEIGNLPFYNEDLENSAQTPEEWTRFRAQIKAADGVIFITPEYNRSVPAALKNALDVGSRPYGQSVWNDKTAGVISSSIGAIGGFGSNQHLRQSLVTLNVNVVQQPEMYLSFVDKSFAEDGSMNSNTRDFIAKFLTAYEKLLKRLN